MLNKFNLKVALEIEKLLELSKASPYVFRTRLERVLYKINHNSAYSQDSDVVSKCNSIGIKLKCLSDQSNQTPDGTLNSFLFLEKDLVELLSVIQ
jgi:hypothetical protein